MDGYCIKLAPHMICTLRVRHSSGKSYEVPVLYLHYLVSLPVAPIIQYMSQYDIQGKAKGEQQLSPPHFILFIGSVMRLEMWWGEMRPDNEGPTILVGSWRLHSSLRSSFVVTTLPLYPLVPYVLDHRKWRMKWWMTSELISMEPVERESPPSPYLLSLRDTLIEKRYGEGGKFPLSSPFHAYGVS